ncbi:NADH:flavin oxidoreductase/NADH oxidase family protein [Aspergillus lucknowensis]|uniref:NADH:flavin oxidoreductase/NADH oxidase N-terminal domain-containing protein n=1 Tax=Aspergillus lucknowensis TaxID=176173 RepID=A0ABR4M7S3_9EURO
MSALGDSVKLPCGLVFPNRIVKAAMAEMLGGFANAPTPSLLKVYGQWGKGNWGAVLTGNVQVDVNHLGTPFDPALASGYTDPDTNKDLVETWRQYANACQEHGPPSIVQLCHPGRQSLRFAGRRGVFASPIAPSAIPLMMGESYAQQWMSWFVFPPPREMTQADIDLVTRQFVDAARLMADAGFSGVELHGAHGYLIDQFLNPKSNTRTDVYGGSATNRAKFVLDILHQIRAVVPSTFCIGIKFNSADHNSASFEHTMTQISLIAEAGIDFIEISGGTYEDPKMFDAGQTQPQPQKSARTAAREAFFLEFASAVRARYPTLILMLTGGFRTRAGAEYALSQNACDLIGIGRPAAIDPFFPRLFLDDSLTEEEARLTLKRVSVPFWAKLIPLSAVGAGWESSYYTRQIQRIAKGLRTIVPL